VVSEIGFTLCFIPIKSYIHSVSTGCRAVNYTPPLTF
jgi:hypothetical protein